jgi:hypothetical protein
MLSRRILINYSTSIKSAGKQHPFLLFITLPVTSLKESYKMNKYSELFIKNTKIKV